MPETNDAIRLGLRLMTLLHQQQKSVYALAKQAGVPLHTVQRICKGEGKQPSVWTIAALARVLGVSMDDLVGLHETPQTTPSAPTLRADDHEMQPTTCQWTRKARQMTLVR